MENILFLSFALVFFTLVFMHIYFTNAFFSQLKKEHIEVWKELGQPQWKIHFGDDSFQNAMKYIRQQKFSDLNDTVLQGYYQKIKNIESTSIGLALLIVAATIIDVVLEG